MEMSAFFGHNIVGGVGGLRDEPKAEHKIVIRSRVLRNKYLEGFFAQSQVLLSSTVSICLLVYMLYFLVFGNHKITVHPK